MPAYSYALTVAAPAPRVWKVLSAVEDWPGLTGSMTSVRGLDGPRLAVGARFAVHQPRLPPAVWTVTGLAEGASFTWESRAPGVVSRARHLLEPAAGGTSLTLGLEQSGVLAWPLAFLLGGTVRRYLALEGQGIGARSEQEPAQ
jgi:hypothetical protein